MKTESALARWFVPPYVVPVLILLAVLGTMIARSV
jgi:hypothetical protein